MRFSRNMITNKTKKIKPNFDAILILICLVVLYEVCTDGLGILNDFLFPGLKRVLPHLLEYWPKLLMGLVSSLGLLIPAYGLAVILGILLGTYIGLRTRLRYDLMPFINGFSAIPPTLLTPFAIQLFPTFKLASIFIIFVGAFWPILGTTISGVSTINKMYLHNQEMLEIRGLSKIIDVILPAASPTILAGCSVALKSSFILLVVAEMFGATSGMGYFVQYYSDFARFELVWLGFLFMSIVLVVIMTLFEKVRYRMLHWTDLK